jgi:4-oxalocrotonate tautomerase
MPRIIVQATKGRSLEQKRGLVRDLTKAMCDNFDVEPDQVTVVIQESDPENIAKGGVLAADRSQVRT